MIRLALIGEGDAVNEYLTLAPRLGDANITAIADITEIDGGVFDAVVIASTEACQDKCLFAATRGKHVFLPTSFASSAEAAAVIQECRTHGVRLMASHLDRFLPSLRSIKQSLDSGQLGDPGLIRIHRWQSQADRTPNASADIDLAMWMFQALPTEVYAVARRGADGAVAYLQIHLGFPAGGMGLIDVSNALASADSYFSLSLIGSTGAAYADDHHNQQLLLRGDHPVALKTGEGSAARLTQLQEFVDSIKQQRELAVTGADWEAALLVTEAAWESIESGRTARLTGERYEC
jgi:myo-inositol 2-dehydrogenase/D-chiro-inositol 1-dehydrogenase